MRVERAGAGGRDCGRQEETFGGDGYVHYLDWGGGSTVTYLKLTKLYTLNLCSLLDVSYTQESCRRKKKKKNRPHLLPADS